MGKDLDKVDEIMFYGIFLPCVAVLFFAAAARVDYLYDLIIPAIGAVAVAHVMLSSR